MYRYRMKIPQIHKKIIIRANLGIGMSDRRPRNAVHKPFFEDPRSRNICFIPNEQRIQLPSFQTHAHLSRYPCSIIAAATLSICPCLAKPITLSLFAFHPSRANFTSLTIPLSPRNFSSKTLIWS